MSTGDLIIIRADVSVQLIYLVLGTLTAATAGYFWWTWRQVGGIRGGMYVLLASCLTVILLGFSVLHAANPRLPVIWVLAIQRAAWPGVVVALAVLADLYAAWHNDHHSLTTRTYNWYKRGRSSNPGAANERRCERE